MMCRGRRRCDAWFRLDATAAFALVALTVACRPARADGPPVAGETAFDTTARDRARELFEDGVRLFKQRKIEAALVAFRAAWALTQHFQIAAYLGECELALGRYRDAAEHLAYALAEPADKTPAEQRERLEPMLASARAKVARLTIRVDADGATVFVGGKSVGSSPLPLPVFVEPGATTVRAVREGDGGLSFASWTRDVAAGAEDTVVLALTAPSDGSARRPARSAPADGGGAAITGSGGRSALPLIVGSVVLAAGAGVAAAFTVAAIDKSDEVDRRDQELKKKGVPCPADSTAAACQPVLDAAKSRGVLTTVAVAGYVGAVAGVAGGIVWYFLQPSRPRGPQRGARARVEVAPAPGAVTVRFAGRF